MKKILFILTVIGALSLAGCNSDIPITDNVLGSSSSNSGPSTGPSTGPGALPHDCDSVWEVVNAYPNMYDVYKALFPDCFTRSKLISNKDFLNTQVNYNEIVGTYDVNFINVLGNNNEIGNSSISIGSATVIKTDSKIKVNIGLKNNSEISSDLISELNSLMGKTVELELTTDDFKQINENEVIISKIDQNTDLSKMLGVFKDNKELILLSDNFIENNILNQNFYFQLIKSNK